MKTFKVLIVILFSLYYSCSTHQSESEKKDNTKKLVREPDADALPEINHVADTNKKIISLIDTLFKGDTLKIKFKTPHPKDFAITTPDDKFFFVIYGFNDTTKPSLIDWNEFANIDNLQIITDRTKANPWDARINENQMIFTKTGKYELHLSENLETDDGTPVEIENVYYVDRKRNE